MKNNQLKYEQLSYIITIARAGLEPRNLRLRRDCGIARPRPDTRLYVSCFSLKQSYAVEVSCF